MKTMIPQREKIPLCDLILLISYLDLSLTFYTLVTYLTMFCPQSLVSIVRLLKL